MAYLEFAKRRKPITAQVRQKISRALKGKRRKKGGKLSNKKKAAISLGVAGGLGAATAVLAQRKGKSQPQGLLAGATDNGRNNDPIEGATSARGEQTYTGVGRKERIGRDPKQNTKRGINLGAIKRRLKK
jgi:hypothetical protein